MHLGVGRPGWADPGRERVLGHHDPRRSGQLERPAPGDGRHLRLRHRGERHLHALLHQLALLGGERPVVRRREQQHHPVGGVVGRAAHDGQQPGIQPGAAAEAGEDLEVVKDDHRPAGHLLEQSVDGRPGLDRDHVRRTHQHHGQPAQRPVVPRVGEPAASSAAAVVRPAPSAPTSSAARPVASAASSASDTSGRDSSHGSGTTTCANCWRIAVSCKAAPVAGAGCARGGGLVGAAVPVAERSTAASAASGSLPGAAEVSACTHPGVGDGSA